MTWYPLWMWGKSCWHWDAIPGPSSCYPNYTILAHSTRNNSNSSSTLIYSIQLSHSITVVALHYVFMLLCISHVAYFHVVLYYNCVCIFFCNCCPSWVSFCKGLCCCVPMCKLFFLKEMIKEDADLFSKVYGINVGVWIVNVWGPCNWNLFKYAYMIKVLQHLEKITTGLETGVPLMHKLVYPSAENSLSCCLNHWTASSCALSSTVNVQPLRAFF